VGWLAALQRGVIALAVLVAAAAGAATGAARPGGSGGGDGVAPVVVRSAAPATGSEATAPATRLAAVPPPVSPPVAAAQAGHTATRVSPPSTVAPAQPSGHCPASGHAAVIDRAIQRAWLCTDGVPDAPFPITTAREQPAPGTYHVYAKDRLTTSTFGGHFSYLDNFVAFTRGIHTGARIAFHAVPRTASGAPFEPYDAVGTPEWYGASSGCIRVLPAQSQIIWDHLARGDEVIVIS
jgi:hypothetical protein